MSVAVKIRRCYRLWSAAGEQIIDAIESAEVIADKDLQAIGLFVDRQDFLVAVAVKICRFKVYQAIANTEKQSSVDIGGAADYVRDLRYVEMPIVVKIGKTQF